jgi:DNA-binding NarL/FixJ family response regulator
VIRQVAAGSDNAERRGSPASAAPRALTARELQVARLVAAGMRNREIASELALSVRTAESHVERIRVKLGFRSRAQIGRWVAQHDILEAFDRP